MTSNTTSNFTRRQIVKGGTALGASLGMGLPLSAADEASLVALAKTEGTGMLYSVIEPTILQALAKAFGDKYGVKLDFERLGTGPLSQRYAAEAEAGKVTADIVMLGDKAFLENSAKISDDFSPRAGEEVAAMIDTLDSIPTEAIGFIDSMLRRQGMSVD